MTPSALLFGINQRGDSVDDVRNFLENHIQTDSRDLEAIRKVPAENVKKSQNYNKNYVDKRRKDTSI